MGVPISVRLDDDIRDELEAQARAHGIGLSTLLRDLATRAATEARRARIRAASAGIGARVLENSKAGEQSGAAAFYCDWGTPRSDG